MTERELEDKITILVGRILPKLLRNTNNSIRSGIVRNIFATGRIVDVEILGTGELLIGIKYMISSGTPANGQYCLVLSADPKLKSTCVAFIFN